MREELERDEAMRAELDEMKELGQLLRRPFDDQEESVSFEGLWNRIERGISQEQPLPWATRVWIAIREHFALYRGAWVASMATACALLILLLPAVLKKPSEQGGARESAPISNEMRVETWEVEKGDVIVKYPKSKELPTVIYHLVDDDEADHKDKPKPESRKTKQPTSKPKNDKPL